MNNAAISDSASTAITTIAKGQQQLPAAPGTNISGGNATISVRMAKVTGAAVSRYP